MTRMRNRTAHLALPAVAATLMLLAGMAVFQPHKESVHAAESPTPVVEPVTDQLHRDHPRSKPRTAKERERAMEAICRFAKDPALKLQYVNTTKNPYRLDADMEKYFAGTSEYYIDPRSDRVLQFGQRPLQPEEPSPPVPTGVHLSQADLDQRARAFIAERAPEVDLSTLRFTVSQKATTAPTGQKGPIQPVTVPQTKTMAFRWEPEGPRVPHELRFVQVVLWSTGHVASFSNTLSP